MLSVKLLNLFRGVFQVACRFPGVFSFTIASPTDEVLKSSNKEFRVSYMVDFVLFFTVDCDWVGRRRREAVYCTSFPL